VIKFYSHLFNGIKTFDAENKAYSIINDHISEKYIRYFPKLLGSGYFFDESNERTYKWPYLVIEASVDGGVSLAEVISGEVLSLNDEVDLNGEKGMVKWGEMTDFSADVLYGKIEISIKYFYFIQ